MTISQEFQTLEIPLGGFARTASSPQTCFGETPTTQFFEAFCRQMASEFTQGSSIDLTQFQTAIALVNETEILDGGDVTYPIHEPRGPSPPTTNNQPLRPLFSVKSTCEELAQ